MRSFLLHVRTPGRKSPEQLPVPQISQALPDLLTVAHLFLNTRGPVIEGARELLVLQTHEHLLHTRPLPDDLVDRVMPGIKSPSQCTVHQLPNGLGHFLPLLDELLHVRIPALKHGAQQPLQHLGHRFLQDGLEPHALGRSRVPLRPAVGHCHVLHAQQAVAQLALERVPLRHRLGPRVKRSP